MDSGLTSHSDVIENESEVLLERPKNQRKNTSTLSAASTRVDKSDPRTNQHFVKFVKRRGITVKLWECSICGREFQHQYMLRRHLPGHTDERNYHCLVCGKSFRQLSTLSQHRTIHSLARPHSCMICGKTFNRISTLISHRKTHFDEKPFKCHICSKGFHQKGNLRNHLFSHTNERPYRCNQCDKGFNQQSNLTCHMKKVHPDYEKATTPTPQFNNTPIHKPPEPVPEGVLTLNVPFNLNNSVTGIIVDPIRTTEMDETLQSNQMPFALLKQDCGRPVLVKIFVNNVPHGKHMLVPVTAQDLMAGGRLIMGQNENGDNAPVKYPENGDPLLHLQVPLVAILESSICPDGQYTLTVHPPSSYYQEETTGIKIEVPQFQEPNLNNMMGIHNSDCALTMNGLKTEKDIIQHEHCSNGKLMDKSCLQLHPMVTTPMKDPVLNNTNQSGEGSGLVGPGMQFGSPQHLLDPQGPPSYVTDFDCRNLELFEPLDYIETGKIKPELNSESQENIEEENTW